MATLTLACTGGTFLSYRNPNSDLSSLTDIPVSINFLGNLNEGEKQRLASTYEMDNGGALFEFPANAALQYKQINNATLIYTIKGESTDTYYDKLNPHYGNNLENSYIEIIAPYITEKNLSDINLNNYKTSGNVGNLQIKKIGRLVGTESTHQFAADVTDIYKSQFAGQIARFLISTGFNSRANFSEFPDTANLNIYAALAEYYYGGFTQYTKRTIEVSSVSLVIDYDDAVQPAPTPTYPCNVRITENTPITFTWLFNASTAAGQKGATLQYRVKEGNWTSVSITSNAKSYVLGDGLPVGSYEWKVCVTNDIDETSAYSDVQEFNVIGKPAAPVINTPSNCCLTTIRWNANGQEAAEIMFYKDNKLLTHETLATTITEYKPQMFLKGNYSIKVRIKNNADMWSDFGVLSFSIDAAGPDKGTLEMIPFDKHVQLNGTTEATNAAIIRRTNGVESIIATAASAIDDTVAGGIEYEYVLRTWDTGGYTDSEPKIVTFDFAGSIIKSNNHELNLKTSEEKFLMHEEAISRNLAVNNFVGREYPVIERGEFTTLTITKRFYISREEKPILDDMAKEPSIFYRDSRGNAFKAVITSLKYNEYMTQDYIAEITLLKTAPNEVIINV